MRATWKPTPRGHAFGPYEVVKDGSRWRAWRHITYSRGVVDVGVFRSLRAAKDAVEAHSLLPARSFKKPTKGPLGGYRRWTSDDGAAEILEVPGPGGWPKFVAEVHDYDQKTHQSVNPRKSPKFKTREEAEAWVSKQLPGWTPDDLEIKRSRRADLIPPLGSPGGPCRVVQRIQDKVTNPKARKRLTKDVEKGRSLRNDQAPRAYKITKEPVQAGRFDKVVIGPHAGYRMDLRTITVPVILRGVRNFVKADEYRAQETLAAGKPIKWDDSTQRLTLVLAKSGPKTLKVITTYWTGKKDPPAPGDSCAITKVADGYREPASALPGVQTYVSNPDGTQDRDPQWLGSNPDKDKAHVAPTPRSRSFPQPRGVNAPPASGESPDGKSLSQDKPRTLGQPGEEYGTPSLNWPQEGPHRRTMKGDFYMERAPAPGPDPTLRYDRATKPLPLTHGDPAHVMNNISPVTDAPGSAKVIPEGKGFVNKEAFRIGEIESLCSPELRQKANGLNIRMRRVDAKNNRWLFDVQGSEPKPYQVRVKAIPKRKNLTDPKKVDILVSCSCPYWRWQGPEHHAKFHKYLLGKPRGTAAKPGIKDPAGNHGACKHTLAVLNTVKGLVLPGRGRKTASSWKLGSLWIVVPRQETLIQRVARRYLEGRGEV